MDENHFMRLTSYMVNRNQQANGTNWTKLLGRKNFILQVTHIRTRSEGITSFLSPHRHAEGNNAHRSNGLEWVLHDIAINMTKQILKSRLKYVLFFVHAFTVITENTYSLNCEKTNKTCHCSTRKITLWVLWFCIIDL